MSVIYIYIYDPGFSLGSVSVIMISCGNDMCETRWLPRNSHPASFTYLFCICISIYVSIHVYLSIHPHMIIYMDAHTASLPMDVRTEIPKESLEAPVVPGPVNSERQADLRPLRGRTTRRDFQPHQEKDSMTWLRLVSQARI